ncbi:TdeIII family type II restriction endonuclease [Geminocystis sp. CENA526]|uniref:TdeIII family type II restriction endonuclease n=1 Tax=Geminocystis sp. CENA526 TaxID=1355871 RepID=UPI003D6EA5F1
MEQKLKEKLKESIKIAIRKFFNNKEVKTSHILDILFPKERRIRSLIGGLETSMGIVWEAIAKTLAEENGYEIIQTKILSPEPFPPKLRQELDSLITQRENKFISTDICIEKLKKVALELNSTNLKFTKPASGTGVDIYFLKNGIEYVFDTKTTQPNQGDFKKFNKQLLEWYCYRFAKNPEANLVAKIAIPFNPYQKNWYEQNKSKIKHFLDIQKDIWVGNEFWDFCSGQTNTWEIIEDIFHELQEEGFNKEFNDIFEGKS